MSGSWEMLLPGVPNLMSPCSMYEHIDRALNDSSSPKSLADCQAGHAADAIPKPYDDPEPQAAESSAAAARSYTAFNISGLWNQPISDVEYGVFLGFHVGLLLALLVALAITLPRSSQIALGGAALNSQHQSQRSQDAGNHPTGSAVASSNLMWALSRGQQQGSIHIAGGIAVGSTPETLEEAASALD